MVSMNDCFLGNVNFPATSFDKQKKNRVKFLNIFLPILFETVHLSTNNICFG